MKMTVLLVAMATAGAASSREGQPNEGPNRVDVCMEWGSNQLIVGQAQHTASQMFAGIGVTIQWHRIGKFCPAEAMQISLINHAAENYFPGALAFALPYDGAHIQIFCDRFMGSAKPKSFPSRLAHVMVHEITHILQGVVRHSESGVMKASWTEADYDEMSWKPLPFTQTDILLIHRGLESRAARAAARAQTTQYH
jgi:hypothetical protein